MATFSNGESGSSVRTKLNDIINKVEGVSDINNNLTVDGNFTVTGDFTVQGTTITVDSATAQTIVLGDNDKMTFGAGSDLQIYHNGTHSFIDDAGAGDLKIRATNLKLNSYSGDNYLTATVGAAVDLYYNNAPKLATTNTGIDVTGTVTADGLTVDGDAEISASRPILDMMCQGASNENLRIDVNVGTLRLRKLNDAKDSATERFHLDLNTGDISFYENTGTTPKMVWKAADERLGIGTSSPAALLHLEAAEPIIRFKDSDGSAYHQIFGNTTDLYIDADRGNNATSNIIFRNDATERMRIDSNGRVKLHEDLVQDEVKATTTATTQTAIDTFPHASYDGAKVVITAATSADTYVTELLIATNGTTAVATEYGQIGTGSALATYDVDISGADVRILATPASTTSTTFRVAMTLT